MTQPIRASAMMTSQGELVRLVAADLGYIRDWRDLDDDSLRRGSNTLRQLLVDKGGLLQRAWKAAGFAKEPRIRCTTLKHIIGSALAPDITIATAGGAIYKGENIKAVVVYSRSWTEAETAERRRIAGQGPPEEDATLSGFIAAPCMLIEGLEVPRRVLINYVANKLGGVHFDVGRAARRHKEKGEAEIYRRLDDIPTRLTVIDKPAVYYELLSIGQVLARSDDIKLFCEKVTGRWDVT